MRLEHHSHVHVVGGYVRYISPHIIIIIKSGATMPRHAWRVDKSPVHIHVHKNQNTCLKVLQLSIGKMIADMHSLRCVLVNSVGL